MSEVITVENIENGNDLAVKDLNGKDSTGKDDLSENKSTENELTEADLIIGTSGDGVFGATVGK